MTLTPGDGSAAGEIVMDVRNGRMTKSTIESTQPMTMSMQGPDGSAVNLSAATKSTTTIELVQKSDRSAVRSARRSSEWGWGPIRN